MGASGGTGRKGDTGKGRHGERETRREGDTGKGESAEFGIRNGKIRRMNVDG